MVDKDLLSMQEARSGSGIAGQNGSGRNRLWQVAGQEGKKHACLAEIMESYQGYENHWHYL